MTISDLLNDKAIKSVKRDLDLFVSETLSEYIKTIEQRLPQAPKEIFDSVWGPIEFNKGEIGLLDSPLLQRLRKIKQLGLASYVYCGADHSRFFHTTGVTYLANKMAGIVKLKLEKLHNYSNKEMDFVQIVRLAAILHDVGHMFFSHVSESYFMYEESSSLQKKFKEALKKFQKNTSPNVSLHEMFSVIIVNSVDMENLLSSLWSDFEQLPTKNERNIKLIIEYISAIICGIPIDKKVLPYCQIINGPIDADKCDYLTRDSHATKVPVAVDIFRLIQKLSVVKVNDIEGKPTVWMDDSDASCYKLSLSKSASKSFVQLIIARSIMYESLYYHHKVITAEAMLKKAFSLIEKEKMFDSVVNLFKITDEAFGTYFQQIFFNDKPKNVEVLDLVKNINLRNFHKRVCFLSKKYLTGSKINLDKFNDKLLNYEALEQKDEFIKKLCKEYNNLANLLEKKIIVKNSEFMIINFPIQSLDLDKIEMPMDYGNGIIKSSREEFQSETWVQSKEIHNQEHIFTTTLEDRELVFIAIQKLLYTDFSLLLSEDSTNCAKIKIEDISKIKTRLYEKNYYTNYEQLIPDTLIKKFCDDKQLDILCRKFQAFEGRDGIAFSKDRLYAFLKQFYRLNIEEDELKTIVTIVLKLLNDSIFINRDLFAESFKTLFEDISKEQNINILPLGSLLDSGKHYTYYLNDIKLDSKININIYEDMESLLKSSQETIILYDDGAFSGTQLLSIFQEYLGLSTITGEKHCHELSSSDKDLLKTKKIVLMYLCFNSNNEEYILKELNNIGIKNLKIKYLHDMKEEAFQKCDFNVDSNELESAIEKFKQIGKNILLSEKKKDGEFTSKWTEDRINSSALGYNNAQQMVILSKSVPTYTITLFWGESNSSYKWMPLFPRTRKD